MSSRFDAKASQDNGQEPEQKSFSFDLTDVQNKGQEPEQEPPSFATIAKGSHVVFRATRPNIDYRISKPLLRHYSAMLPASDSVDDTYILPKPSEECVDAFVEWLYVHGGDHVNAALNDFDPKILSELNELAGYFNMEKILGQVGALIAYWEELNENAQ